MYSFVFTTNNPIKLFATDNNNNADDYSFLGSNDSSNETVTKSQQLDSIPYGYDEDTQTQNMNSSLVMKLKDIASTSSGNFSMSTESYVDKKIIQDIGNVTLAISKV